MKKIFAVSLIAITAVSAANAEIASKGYVDQLNTAMDTRVTSNTTAINTLNGSGEGSVAAAIAAAITDTYNAEDGDHAMSGVAVASAISGVTSTADNAVQTVKVNSDPLTEDADGAVNITVTTGDSTSGNGTIKVNGTAVPVYGLDTAAYQPTSAFATAAQGSTAETTAATVSTYGDIVTHNVSEFATSTQGDKADTAVQPAGITTGTANGTIAVNGTDVSVAGLGTAAYKADTYFEQAGAANTALSGLTLSSVGGNGTVVKTVSQSNGQVSATAGQVAEADIADGAVVLSKLSAVLPSDCQASGQYDCSLVSHNGLLTWEKITRASNEAALNPLTGSTANN